jgi:NAD(P)H-flavin reductase
LKEIQEVNPRNFRYYDTLTRHDESKHGEWDGLTGRVDWNMMQECGFPAPADDVLILVCGPKGLHEAVNKICDQHGYKKG